MDFSLRDWLVVLALAAFNLPILYGAIKALTTPELSAKVGGLLKEKTADGDVGGATSFSRVTGAIGAVVVASLFWVVSNIVIATAILSPSDVGLIVNSSGKLFLVGAALFLPYAFNQLKSLLQ
jgi:hypothetical protein